MWGPGYLKSRMTAWREPLTPHEPVRVWLAIADHFEPLGLGATEEEAAHRVDRWSRQWPVIASRHRDAAGNPPQYTFFYPEEEYRPELIDRLAEFQRLGIGDVEIHIHHDGEGERNFVDRMIRFKQTLSSRHGLLRRRDGDIAFGFIHGNWALDNSRLDGRWCGLNNEISLLRQLGCYADFTMPSGNSETQARMVNTIYWAVDDPRTPKSYDTGVPVKPGQAFRGDLLMVPGPLGIRWRERALPRIEKGELAGYDLPSSYRFDRWLDVAPRLGNNIFIKLFTHGCQDRNSVPLLEHGALDRLFEIANSVCSGRNYELHFVSAWQMFLAIEDIRTNGNSAGRCNAALETLPGSENPHCAEAAVPQQFRGCFQQN
jgi:hypothetical protein